MSRNINGIPVICPEPPRECEFCGAFEECRPYGPKGEQICFACSQKDKKGTEKRMKRILFGETEPQ